MKNSVENILSEEDLDKIISRMKEKPDLFPVFHTHIKNQEKDFLLQNCPDEKFLINAQKLYDETYTAMYIFFPKSSDKISGVEYACAEHSMKRLFEKATGLGDNDFSQVFSRLISLQKEKIDALKNGVTEVYHYSQVDNLALIKAFEQPVGNNLRTNVGKKAVYASPDKESIYPLKVRGNKNEAGEYAFNHKYKIGYITYGEGTTFKSPEDFIDKLEPAYRYVLDAKDFYPSVSLAGIYSKEWEAYKDVEIKTKEGPFTIDDVVKSGYNIYFVSENHKSDIKNLMRNSSSREDLINKLSEVCQNPDLGIISYADNKGLQDRARGHYDNLLKLRQVRSKLKDKEKQPYETSVVQTRSMENYPKILNVSKVATRE